MGDKPDYENGQPKPISNSGASMHDLVSEDLLRRKEYGLNKYESLLQVGNGRDFLQDLYEEMQDGIVYLRGAIEEQEIASRLIKFLLQKVRDYRDTAYPELAKSGQKVLQTRGFIPAWIFSAAKEVLGDDYEHIPE